MKQSIFLIVYICAFLHGFTVFAQDRKIRTGSPILLAANIFQEAEMLSPGFPYGATANVKLSRLFLQAGYRFNPSKISAFQVLPSAESYSGRVGFMGGVRLNDDINFFGISAGYSNINTLKRINLSGLPMPEDLSGRKYEIENALMYYRGNCYALGFHLFNYIRKENRSLELLADDFDLKINGKKKRQTLIQLTLDLLYMPQISYDSTLIYSPWGSYVPKELAVGDVVKTRNWGVAYRMEYSTFTGLGFIMDMGLLPGIRSKTTDENDFNFSFKAGVNYNFYYVR